MAKKTNILIGALVAVALVLCSTTTVYGIWAVEFESKTVGLNETDISIAMRVYWDLDLLTLIVPVVVRSVSGGAFWVPPLPEDEPLGGPPVGVTWNWSNPGWAYLAEDVLTGIPGGGCDPEGDTGYDGTSPDHFCVAVGGMMDGTPAEPSGRDVLSLTINANGNPGDFEFDTACYSPSINTIHMTDEIGGQHGAGYPDFDHFTKGIITITAPAEYNIPWLSLNGGGDDESSTSYQVMYSVGQRVAGTGASTNYDVRLGYWYGADYGGGGGECDCGVWGDVTGDGNVNPVDVVFMVNRVYLGNDMVTQHPDCPRDAADINCDGNVNPVDVVFFVNRVYLGNDMFCADPCL